MAFAILGNPKPAFFDSSGAPLANGTLTIVEPSTDVNKATYPTYDDAEALTNPNDNPITLDSRGECDLWGLDGEDYKLTLKDSAGATVWTTDDVFLPGRVFAQTAAESAAGVTPTNLKYEPGNVLRYGTNTTPGTTDMTTAIQNAIDIAKAVVVAGSGYNNIITEVVYIPPGRYATSQLKLYPGVVLQGADISLTILEHDGTGLVDFIVVDETQVCEKTSIKDLQLKGNGVTNTRYGIKLHQCYYTSFIENVIITNCQYGMYLTDCWTLNINNCHVRSNSYGCYWDDANAARVTRSRFEANTNYNMQVVDAGSLYIGQTVFQEAEADDSLILTLCDGTVIDGCNFETNNKDDNSKADLNISGSVAAIHGGYFAQTAGTTGIAITASLTSLTVVGVMISPASTHATGLKLTFGSAWGSTSIISAQLGAGGIDTSSYAGSVHSTGMGYGASPELGTQDVKFFGPPNRNRGVDIGNKTFSSRLMHPDSRGSYDEEVLLITSPDHTTNNNNTDHTMELDTRTQVQASISGITKGATTTITTAAAHGFTTGWTVDIASITDSGAGDLEAALNGNSYVATVVDSTSFTVSEDTSGDSATWSSGGTATRPAKQTVKVQGTWDKPFYLGDYAFWVNTASDKVFFKDGTPTDAVDGTVLFDETTEVLTTTKVVPRSRSGTTYYLDASGGFAVTLPTPKAGLKYTFIVTTAPTTAYTVGTASGNNILFGTVWDIVGDAVYYAADDTVNFVANTSVVGDRLQVESDDTNWYFTAVSGADGGITVSVT